MNSMIRKVFQYALQTKPFIKIKQKQATPIFYQQNQDFIKNNMKFKMCIPFIKQLQHKEFPQELKEYFSDYQQFEIEINQLIIQINTSKDVLKSFNLDLYNFVLLAYHVNLLTQCDFSQIEKELLAAFKQQKPRQPLLIRGLKLATNTFPINDLLPLILKRDQSRLFSYCFKHLSYLTINLFQATTILEQLEKAHLLEKLVNGKHDFVIKLSQICINSLKEKDDWNNIAMVAKVCYYNPQPVLETIIYKSTQDIKIKIIATLINSLSKVVENYQNPLFKECVEKLIIQLKVLNQDLEQDLAMIAWDLFKLNHDYYKILLPKLKIKLLSSKNLQNIVQFYAMTNDKTYKEYLVKSHIKVKELNPSMLAIFLDGVDKFDLSMINDSQISPQNIARLIVLCGIQNLGDICKTYIERDQIDLKGLQIICQHAPEFKEFILKKLIDKINLSEIEFRIQFRRQLKNVSSLLLELDSELVKQNESNKLLERFMNLYLNITENQSVQGLGNLIYLTSKHSKKQLVLPNLEEKLFKLDPIELLNLWKVCEEDWIDLAIVEGLKKSNQEISNRFKETLQKVKRGDIFKLKYVHQYFNL